MRREVAPSPVQVKSAAGDRQAWLELRQQLWPHCTVQEHSAEIDAFMAEPARFAQFIACDGVGQAIGLVEVALRSDYVNGTDTSPVAFLEGIYVVPGARRRGVARQLVASAEAWAVTRRCTEFASDARIENTASHALHAALGFAETERVVYFRKLLA